MRGESGCASADRAAGRVKSKQSLTRAITEWLTLPVDVITALRLRFWSLERCELADGSECQFEVHVGTVVWDGKGREIHVDRADTVPLVGMKLMKGFELKMQVRPRGTITIKRLPGKNRVRS